MPRIRAVYGMVSAMFFDERTHTGRPHLRAQRPPTASGVVMLCPFSPSSQAQAGDWSAGATL
ncbi:MAG TPA: hypothetical protein VNF24_01410 [Candidatus Acidoferrales bacterium]|nr:hypothetical protein [Candidatus Acidoferrales bacterium]